MLSRVQNVRRSSRTPKKRTVYTDAGEPAAPIKSSHSGKKKSENVGDSIKDRQVVRFVEGPKVTTSGGDSDPPHTDSTTKK